jgi:hypothetical protein
MSFVATPRFRVGRPDTSSQKGVRLIRRIENFHDQIKWLAYTGSIGYLSLGTTDKSREGPAALSTEISANGASASNVRRMFTSK